MTPSAYRRDLHPIVLLGANSPLLHSGGAWLHVPRSIGIFGGTFDPPHLGHLVIAVNVRHELALDLVLFVVAGSPWQKIGDREVSPAADRLAMTQAALDNVKGMEVSDLDVVRPGPSYTADTVADLRAHHPGVALFVIPRSRRCLGTPDVGTHR